MTVQRFQHHPSVAEFTISKHSYLAARPGVSFSCIATSTLVIDTRVGCTPRILLLQRASCEKDDPNRWEPPGGACDDDDESILHAAARELLEEAGLQTCIIGGPVINRYFFSLDDGREVCRFYFAVGVKTDGEAPLLVRLNPEEHQSFVWATEDQVKARKVDSIRLEFTTETVAHTLLMAFQRFREF
ncbi:NUDIX hydrolase domain-like protein [Xylariaceae sp. FL1019]|nr:NUDIX hydrolase domain-like protein [Xylariaceae sp. FL1019]